MCLMDWRLGRVVRSVLKHQSIAQSSTFLIPSNQQRVAITFLNNDTVSTYYAMPGDVGAQAQFGIDLAMPCDRHFTLATHGDLPMGAWTLLNNDTLAAETFYWVEYYMTEKSLSRANQYLQTEGFF